MHLFLDYVVSLKQNANKHCKHCIIFHQKTEAQHSPKAFSAANFLMNQGVIDESVVCVYERASVHTCQ